MSAKERKRMYRRRRIIFFSALVVVLAMCVFTVYSLVRGAVNVHDARSSAAPALTRTAAPTPAQKSKVKTCTAQDVDLQLVPDATSVGIGGSLTFTEKVTYSGSDPAGCRINTAAESLVLTIKTGNDVVWRSDLCEATYRPRLFFSGVSDEQKVTWNTNRTGESCAADDQLPKVDRGTYVAQLSLKDNAKVQSQPQTITVE